MIFDLTANANGRKLPTLDPNYPLDQILTFIQGNANSVTFECRIAKDGRPTQYAYQWYLDGSPVSSATGPSCTLSGFTASGTHTVSCTVTNAAGAVETRTATLTVNMYTLPALNSSYPADVNTTVIKGNSTSATFSVSIATAGVPASYSYQWYFNGNAVDYGTEPSFTVYGLDATATYSVYCVVSNAAGSVTSRTATLSVTQYYTPTLNGSYPADVSKTFIKGNSVSASFSASISSAGNPASYTYQWYVDNAAVSGATGSSYTWTGSAAGTHTVYCKVTNAAGTVQTRVATLSVVMYYTPVLNSSYPADATVTINNAVTCKVSISAAGNPASYTYQWYKNGSAVSGATGSSYTFTPTTPYNVTVYCKVTNSAGTVQSRTATITVSHSYLYYHGTFYGGQSLEQWYSSNGSYTIKSDCINTVTTDAGGMYFCLASMVSLTGKSTVKMKIRSNTTYNNGSNNWAVNLWVATSKTNFNNAAANTYVKTFTAGTEYTLSLDVSSFTGNYYIHFCNFHGGGISGNIDVDILELEVA